MGKKMYISSGSGCGVARTGGDDYRLFYFTQVPITSSFLLSSRLHLSVALEKYFEYRGKDVYS